MIVLIALIIAIAIPSLFWICATLHEIHRDLERIAEALEEKEKR